MPPIRLAILDYLARRPNSFTTEVRKGIDKPHATIDRQLQALHMLGAVGCEEVEVGTNSRWRYSLCEGIDPTALLIPEI